jgi:hypothetical protein
VVGRWNFPRRPISIGSGFQRKKDQFCQVLIGPVRRNGGRDVLLPLVATLLVFDDEVRLARGMVFIDRDGCISIVLRTYRSMRFKLYLAIWRCPAV